MRGVSHMEGDEASAQGLKPEGPRAEVGFLGTWEGGSEPPSLRCFASPPARGSGSTASSPVGSGRAPENLKFGAT